MYVDSINNNRNLSVFKDKTNTPNFKAKLVFEQMPKMEFPDFLCDNHNESKKAMYLLQKAINTFLSLPNDLIFGVRNNGVYDEFVNLKTGSKYNPVSYFRYTGNEFLDRFINMVLPDNELNVSEGEALLRLDTKNGKLKNCVDVFNDNKEALSHEGEIPEMLPIAQRLWEDLSEDESLDRKSVV